ncbi:hypothetical protein J6590_099077 [Homalodisca vitripennis]|nr:hypothetical protein J6590_099077 [Homalodisca vitripennis]
MQECLSGAGNRSRVLRHIRLCRYRYCHKSRCKIRLFLVDRLQRFQLRQTCAVRNVSLVLGIGPESSDTLDCVATVIATRTDLRQTWTVRNVSLVLGNDPESSDTLDCVATVIATRADVILDCCW